MRHSLYDILGVNEKANQDEIKNAFIRLSKEYHPDARPNDPAQHTKFVKLNEAYTILSKADLRRDYDFNLKNYQPNQHDLKHTAGKESRQMRPDTTIWEWRDKTQDRYYGKHRNYNYYGIKGIQRVDNKYIAMGAVVLMGIGAFIHYCAIKRSHKLFMERCETKNHKLNIILENTRNKAYENGNDNQLKILESKLNE